MSGTVTAGRGTFYGGDRNEIGYKGRLEDKMYHHDPVVPREVTVGREAGMGGLGFTPHSQGGTHIVERNLTRLTVVVAVVWLMMRRLRRRLRRDDDPAGD